MFDEVVLIISERSMKRIRMSAAGKERRDRLTQEGKCLGCEETIEPNDQTTCGQHRRCYLSAMYLIQKKQTTREKLVREGYMLVPTSGGRKPSEISKKLMEA